MSSGKRKRHAEQVALARYGAIAPLVCREMSSEEFREELERVVSLPHRFPEGLRRVSGRTVRRWCRHYLHGRVDDQGHLVVEAGLDALEPTPRADRGKPRVLELEVVEEAVRLRKERPGRKATQLLALLECQARARDEKPPEVKESTLNYHLRARGATRRQLREPKRAFRRFEHPYRNSCWQGDWTDGIWLPHPQRPGQLRKCYLHGFVDDHTRSVPHAEFYFRQNLPCLADAFRKAILKGGVPEMTYVDNGSCYQADQFKRVAARLKTNLIFATEYAPEGKGKIERWIGGIKDAFLDEAECSDVQNLEELNVFLWGWLDRVYHSRVHSQTGETPRARWEAGTERVRWVDPALLVDVFWWEETRKVDKSGCFSLGGNSYPVGEHLVRESVEVRFDPFDLDVVRVYHRGLFMETASPQKLTSRTYHKALPRRREKPTPLESSRMYRRQLSEDYREQVQATLDGLGAGTAPNPQGYLSEAEWTRLLAEGLGRSELRVHEKTLVHQFFQRHAPLSKEVVSVVLRRAVTEKGRQLHMRVYLRWIREGVAAARGGGE